MGWLIVAALSAGLLWWKGRKEEPTAGDVAIVSSDGLTPVETPGLMASMEQAAAQIATRPNWSVRVTGYDGSVMCKGVANIDGTDVNVIFPGKAILS